MAVFYLQNLHGKDTCSQRLATQQSDLSEKQRKKRNNQPDRCNISNTIYIIVENMAGT